MATLVHDTLCCTMCGLSKVYRACGYRVGWAAFSGDLEHSRDYLTALELLSSLRLCSNVPGQWAVQTALGGYQSIRELTAPGRAAVRVAPRDPRRRSRAAGTCSCTPPTRRDVRVRRRRPDAAAGLRRPAVRAGPARAQARAASRRARASTCRTATHFRITNLPEPRCWSRCSRASRSCSRATRRAERPAAGHAPDLRSSTALGDCLSR